MPFCPECHREYLDRIKECTYCGTGLVEKLSDTAQSQNEDLDLEPLVTIATFIYPEEAHLNRAKLQSEGIFCFVTNEHTVRTNWLYATAFHGVQLRVRKSDAKAALAILQADKKNTLTKTASSIVSNEIYCPRCGSANVRRRLFDILPRKCRSCGHQWIREK